MSLRVKNLQRNNKVFIKQFYLPVKQQAKAWTANEYSRRKFAFTP